MYVSIRSVGLAFLGSYHLMWAAIFGDILIVLGLWKGITLLILSVKFKSPGRKGYLTLILLSFVASFFLEWAVIFLDLWQYTSVMPAVAIFKL